MRVASCVVLAASLFSFSSIANVPISSATAMYWADFNNHKIQRASLDGTAVEDVAAGLEQPVDVAVDRRSGKVYWTDFEGKIQRSNLDGGGVEDLVIGGRPFGLDLDLAGGKMYWTDDATDTISRANLDGSSIEILVTTPLSFDSRAIALDHLNGKMYWTDNQSSKIQRANFDGSDIEDLITIGLGDMRGIDLDSASRTDVLDETALLTVTPEFNALISMVGILRSY